MIHVRFEGRPKEKPKTKKKEKGAKPVVAILNAQVHQVSSAFWFACWIMEKILDKSENRNEKGRTYFWERQKNMYIICEDCLYFCYQ